MSSRREKRFWSRKRREKPPIDDLPVVRLTSFNIPSTTVDCPTEACSGYNNAIKPVITTHRSDPTSSSSGIFGTKLTHHSKKSTASRLSIHSLLYPSSVQCTEIEARTKSRSVHDLVATRPIWDTSADESNSDRDSMLTNNNNNNNNLTGAVECVLCFEWKVVKDIFVLIACDHRPCGECMKQYAIMEVTSSRVELSCPACSALVHPGDVYRILADERDILAKYEKFSVRRALMLDADTRWCPAPDCGYAVIASGCAGCPMLICRRDSCDTRFCYHCKEEWHANQTCDQARLERHGSMFGERLYGDLLHVDSTLKPGDIKSCPRCHTPIVKMQDGSCNHMVCALCHAEFCWLCMKEISDLHYLSPSGCTFWGKKPWSRKKKLFWQLGTLIGAPVGIGLIAGLAVPAIIFGVPIWVGRKIHQRLRNSKRVRHHFAVTGGVVATVILSPVLATMAVGVGVPIMLAYVYGVVPLSLCRNGTCGVSASSSGVNLDINENAAALFSVARFLDGNNQEHNSLLSKDLDKNLTITLGDNSTVTGMSIQSGTSSGLLVGTTGSFGNRLQVHADIFPRMDASTVPHSHTGQKRRLSIDSAANSLYERVVNYEEASTKGLAGSTCCDDKSIRDSEAVSYCGEDQSTRALAGSLYTADAKSVCGAKSVCSEDASVRALAGSICYDGHSLRGTDTNFDGTSFAQQRPPIVEDPLPSGGSNSIGGSKASSRERLYVPCASATQFGSGNHATNPNVPQKQIKFVDQCDEYTHEGDKCTRCRVAAVESDMPDGRGGASIGAAAAYNVKLCYDCSKSLDGTNSEAVDGRYLLHPVGGKIRQPSTSSYMEDDEDYDETLPEIRKSVSIGGLIQQGCGARTGTAGAPVKSRKKSWRRGSGILSRLRRSTGGSSTSFDEIAADSNEFSAMMNVIPGLTLAVPVSSRLSATLPRVSGGAVAHFGRLAPAPVAQRRQTVPFNTSTAASSSEVPSAGIIEQADVAASGRDRGASFLERMSRNRNRYASLPEIEEAGDLISYSLSRLSGLMK